MMKREYDSRLDKWNVFTEKTTYLNDFRYLVPDEHTIYRWQRGRTEPPPMPIPQYDLCDHETFLPWRRGVHVPFDLLWEPKPIIQTHPRDKIVYHEPLVDTMKEEVMKTRPRVYIAPGISMDDIPDKDLRAKLVKFMYTTEWKEATEEAALPIQKKKCPESVADAMGDPITLEVSTLISLPEGWREKGRPWDKEQRRAKVDPTKQFWFHKDPPVKCGACEDPVGGLVTQETKDYIRCLIETERLRLAHDLPKPGYTGYKPRMTVGVPLPKANLHFTHPLLSTNQVIQALQTDEMCPIYT